MVFIEYTLILSGVAVATIAAIRSLGFGLITRDDGGQASYMSAPKRLAALSLLDDAGIAHKDLERRPRRS
jgi:hypothetical protein